MSFATVILTALPSERRCGLLWMVPLPMVVVPTRRAPFIVRRLAANSSAALAVLPLTRQTMGSSTLLSSSLLPMMVRFPFLSSA